MLEQTLQMYEVRKREVYKLGDYSGLYGLLSGSCGGGGIGGGGFGSGGGFGGGIGCGSNFDPMKIISELPRPDPISLPKPTIPSIEGLGSVLRTQYEMDSGWSLQERFDFSGHNNTGPHINYDFITPEGNVAKLGASLRRSLGELHKVKLFGD